MKNLLVILFFITTAIGIPSVVLASGAFDLGGVYNPLYIQVKPDPFANAKQQLDQAISRSRSIQRVQGCEAKSSAIDSFKTKMFASSDFADPVVQSQNAMYLNYLLDAYDSCVQSIQRLDQDCKNVMGSYGKLGTIDLVGKTYQCACQNGTEQDQNSGQCVPIKTQIKEESLYVPKAIPQDTFNGALCILRQHTQWDDNTRTCGCISGYEGKEGGVDCSAKAKVPTLPCRTGYIQKDDECVVASKTPPTPPNNDEACQNRFGPGWKWDGTTNDKGGLICECASGYYQTPNAECALMPKNTTAVTKTKPNETPKEQTPRAKKVADIEKEVSLQNSKDQACIETYGEHSLSKNGGCGCMVGYSMAVNGANVETGCVLETVNEQKTAVEAPRIETPIQHKSLWARIKSWFGFN